jgi:hypothetical protein
VTETFKKLNYRAQSPILVLGAPASFAAELATMAAEADIRDRPRKGELYGFALAFGLTRAAMTEAASKLLPLLKAPLGLRPVRQIAIDEDWSAMRFKREA